MIRINNINTTVKIPPSIIVSLIPSDNQIVTLIKDKLGIDIISNGIYSIDIYIPYVNLHLDNTSSLVNLDGLESANIPVNTNISIDINTDDIKYNNQYTIIGDTSIYTDFKGIEYTYINDRRCDTIYTYRNYIYANNMVTVILVIIIVYQNHANGVI